MISDLMSTISAVSAAGGLLLIGIQIGRSKNTYVRKEDYDKKIEKIEVNHELLSQRVARIEGQLTK